MLKDLRQQLYTFLENVGEIENFFLFRHDVLMQILLIFVQKFQAG